MSFLVCVSVCAAAVIMFLSVSDGGVVVPVSVLYVWVYLVVEMGIYVFVGRAAICISEVSGLWWKVEGIGGE